MEQTQIQKEIEKKVTNGLGYRGFSQRDFERATNPLYHEDDLDLQAHLGMMDYAVADNDFSKQVILGRVMDLGKVRERLVAYGLEGQVNYETPDQVNAAVDGVYRAKEAAKREREDPIMIHYTQKFDPSERQDSVVRDLEFSLSAKPFQSNLIKPREDEQRDTDKWYAGRMDDINRAERRFQAQLNVAVEDGKVDSSDAFRFQTGGIFNPFERLKEKARQDYSHMSK